MGGHLYPPVYDRVVILNIYVGGSARDLVLVLLEGYTRNHIILTCIGGFSGVIVGDHFPLTCVDKGCTRGL